MLIEVHKEINETNLKSNFYRSYMQLNIWRFEAN